MTDADDLVPADFDPALVFRVVSTPVDQGWGVWLRAADDGIIHSFGLRFPPGTPFVPDVLDVLGPLLNLRFGLTYGGRAAWDELDNHWSAVVYEREPKERRRGRGAAGHPFSFWRRSHDNAGEIAENGCHIVRSAPDRATGGADGTPGRVRTDTGRILSPLPLPIGLRGRGSRRHPG